MRVGLEIQFVQVQQTRAKLTGMVQGQIDRWRSKHLMFTMANCPKVLEDVGLGLFYVSRSYFT